MPTTIGINLPLSVGKLTLTLELRNAGVILNTGGDALVEVGTSGYFEASVAETIAANLDAIVKDSGNAIAGGVLYLGQTQVDRMATVSLAGLATEAKQDAAKAVIDAIEEDTETTLPGLIAAAGSVNVLPATGIVADRSPGATISPVVGETISQSITLYATDGTTPINLSGKTLAIVFETMAGVDVAVVVNADITVSGASSNVVTFAYPSAVTESERTLRFAIKDAAAPLTEYLKGICNVTSGPRVDA